MNKLIKVIGVIIAVFVVGFLLIQLIPYGRDHTNPPVVSEVRWNNLRTKELAQRACFDCHSNETTWPWYSNIAPGSWLIYSDVVEGRRRLNFSDWNNSSRRAGEASEVVLEDRMPPIQYIIIHKNAILASAEKVELSKGLAATLGQ